MAILLEARLWDAQYEWWAHEPLARKAGLPDAIIENIRAGKRPEGRCSRTRPWSMTW